MSEREDSIPSDAGSRGKWGKADYLRNSMQYFFTECLYLTFLYGRLIL